MGDIVIDDPVTVEGKLTQLQLSGLGPNSGEITLGVTADDGTFTQMFGGIMDGDRKAPYGLEHGVFAGFVTMATTAFVSGVRVRATHRMADKPRLTGLDFVR